MELSATITGMSPQRIVTCDHRSTMRMPIARHARTALLVGVLLLAAGCAWNRAYVRPGFLEHPPRRVAVLPFVITYAYDTPNGAPPPEHAAGRDILRKTFYDAVTPFGYEDIAPSHIDEVLAARWGAIDEGKWRAATPQELGEALGADAVIYGDIARIAHVATPLYTNTNFDVTFRMVDTHTGDELWRKHVTAAERGGVLFKSGQVVDLIQDQIRSQHAEQMFQRVADLAAARAVKDFPNPPRAAFGAATTKTAAAASTGMKRLAILPLNMARASWHEAAELLRRDLAAHLHDGPFEIIELQQVEEVMERHGWNDDKPWPADLPVDQIARELSADLVLRGTVTKWERKYLGVESWVSAGLQLELVDTATGQVIWSEQRDNRRQAGILKGPTGYLSVATAPIMGVTRGRQRQVGDELTRTLAEHLLESKDVRAHLSSSSQ